MTEFLSNYGYVGIIGILIATGFGLPIPEELPIITAGVLVGHGDTTLRWWLMLPACIVGVVLGDGALYFLGRMYGPRLLANPWVQRRIISPEKRVVIEKNFQERGVLILLTARLTPGIRTPVFMMAGVLRVPLGRFLLADGIYAIPGISILFWLAYCLTDQVLEVFHKIEAYRSLVLVAVLSAVAGVLVYHLFFTRKVSTGSQKEVPLYNKPVEKVTEAVEHAVEKAVEKTVAAVHHMSHPDKPPEPPAPPAS